MAGLGFDTGGMPPGSNEPRDSSGIPAWFTVSFAVALVSALIMVGIFSSKHTPRTAAPTVSATHSAVSTLPVCEFGQTGKCDAADLPPLCEDVDQSTPCLLLPKGCTDITCEDTTDPVPAYLRAAADPAYRPLNARWLAIVQSEQPGRDGSRCVVKIADTSRVICPDGWTYES